ncbi:hypothetical protein E2C01_071904 [Portunus trituberculatus]|uniref:Uncharacterized protein n=1 Tax=Portunus trituberculatus TaxID=210409 RepID=A0A5B7HY93_PORTR|nr:hypothetical protein [Portunus trituberculatus]
MHVVLDITTTGKEEKGIGEGRKEGKEGLVIIFTGHQHNNKAIVIVTNVYNLKCSEEIQEERKDEGRRIRKKDWLSSSELPSFLYSLFTDL